MIDTHQKRILTAFRASRFLTTKELSSHLGVSPRTALNLNNAWVESGFILKEGERKSRRRRAEDKFNQATVFSNCSTENRTFTPKSPLVLVWNPFVGQFTAMKISVELPPEDVKTICEMTGIRKKGPAIREIIKEAIMMRKRAELTKKFMSGEYCDDLEGFEESREKDRRESRAIAEAWTSD